MNSKLNKIDESNIHDHYYLEQGDLCLYLLDYTSNKGYDYSDTNQLISNFKKKPSCLNSYQKKYKASATKKIAKIVAKSLKTQSLKTTTIFIPVPPSKIQSNPDHDDRLIQVLQMVNETLGGRLQICNCLAQNENRESSSSSGKSNNLSPEDRSKTYYFDITKIPSDTKTCVIFDDMITTGSHFKGIQALIKQHFPHMKVIGFFVARRVFPPERRIDLSTIEAMFSPVNE